jgi:glycosyltransferase involved in cell wall biosynthesis
MDNLDNPSLNTSLDSQIPILCFSTTDWNEAFGSRQQLMLLLAQRGHPVLFIERQVGPEQLLRDQALRARKLAAWKSPRLRQIKKNIWLWQPPMLPPGRYYSIRLNRLGQKYLADEVQQILEKLKFQSPILWLYPPQSSPLLGRFREILSIYHCIENFSGNQGRLKQKAMQSEENDLLRKVDIVFTHSQGLLTRSQDMTKREMTLIPSAADVDYFQSISSIDPSLANIPYPRLGVMGTLDARLDIPLLFEIFQEQNDWQLVLIGPLHPERVDLKNLLSLPNVHTLGPQPFERLPAILNGLDIFLIPYVINDMTRYISPIKLYEYLAVGKPVVSTDLPEVSGLAPFIRIATGKKDFIQHIQSALVSDTPDQQKARRREAQKHSWKNRLNVMVQVISETIKEKANEAD